MKKALSLILALALVISLVPLNISAVETGATKTFYFANFSGVYGSVSNLSNAEPEGIDYLSDKSTAITSNNTKRLDDGLGSYVQIVTENKAWKDAKDNESQVVFTVDLGAGAAAGWYQIAFTGGNWYPASDLYIYANDTYVGEYIPKKDVSAHEMGSTKTYGAVYLEPDANGKVEFKVAAAKMGVRAASGSDASTAYWEGRILLSNLSLKYLGTKDDYNYKISHTIPATLSLGEPLGREFAAYLDADDGIARTMNGISSTRAANDDFFKVEVLEGDSLTLKSTVTAGVAEGKLVPVKTGETTLKITASLGGVPYEEMHTVNVVEAIAPPEPVPVTVDFTKATIGTNDPTSITSEDFSVVTNETGNYNGSKVTLVTIGSASAMQIPHKRYDNAKWLWLEAVESSRKDAQFTIKVPLAAPGYYTLDVSGFKYGKEGSEYYVYADDKYAGYVSFYGGANQEAFTNRLNTLYLEPNADNTVKIMFATAANPAEKWVNILYLQSLKLTPVENLEKVEFKEFSETLPEEVTVGTPVDFTVSAKMNDGSLRRTNGYNSVAETDAGNYTTVAVKSGAATLTKTSNDALCDGVYAGTLTANAPGDVVLTMTSCIDGGTPVSRDITVTVPYTDGSVAAQENVSYIVRGSKTEFNAGIDMTGYTAGDVGSHPINTSFTAKALEEITVGGKTYNFAYWQTAGDTPIEDAGESYTFTPKSNFTLEAVYVPAEPTDADKKVQFWNYNRVYLGEVTDVGETLGEKMPQNPSLNGFKFEHWRTAVGEKFNKDTVLTDAITRVVAYFTAITDDFAVEFDTDGDGDVDKTVDADYGEKVTETATEENFSYWTIDGKPVSYENEISFCAWNDVTVTAVYEGTKTAAPTVVLDNIGDEYFITYEVPTGYTAIDAGIVFGSNEPRVDSTDGSKASVREIKAKGQFAATPHPDAAHNVARGYIMYKVNTTGDIRVIYSK